MKILLLGSGALKIGQAGEFDYSGSQAIKALKEENHQVILINPNIATIQTSQGFADKVYFLPVEPHFVQEVIKKEKPQGVMLAFGGQTALNCGLELEKKGIFKNNNVSVLGTSIDTIKKTEDRALFANTLSTIGLSIPKSQAVTSVENAKKAVNKIGYPVMVRGGFSLGGQDSGIAQNAKELIDICKQALAKTPQILIEEYLTGWKEIEYEVVRDKFDNCITVCNMENFDPMGIHTGESIVVAPSQTLNNFEYHGLRQIAIQVIRHLKIVGECNIQFALNPKPNIKNQLPGTDLDYRIIEVNARLSRSSALASKATGYPLAYIAAKLALGYALTDLKNSVTKQTIACFEPALDYLVVKIPRWDLGKFLKSEQRIGSYMQSVGEVMAIGRKFEEAIQKAARMLDIGMEGIMDQKTTIIDYSKPTPWRLFAVAKAIQKGAKINKIYKTSGIDPFFLEKIKNIANLEDELVKNKKKLSVQLLIRAKEYGMSDKRISKITKISEQDIATKRKINKILPKVKQIDTLAAEYPAKTNYLYLTYNGESDDISYLPRETNNVIVLGSGPYRIGSSVEFDWCSVSCAKTLEEYKVNPVIINCNPETVSTDYDMAKRLYFEELSAETVTEIYHKENPKGVIVSMGGQTPNNLAIKLNDLGLKILGTKPESIDTAEDRNKFSNLCDQLKINQPLWAKLKTVHEALSFAQKTGYPVLIRPSYVLSGAAMNVAFTPGDLKDYLTIASQVSEEYPVVISQFHQNAKEIEIDAIARNGKILTHAITEHVENAGIHSGDSTIVLPAQKLYLETVKKIEEISHKLAVNLNITGPFNIQFLAINNKVMVIECNLRASRSLPFVSKVTGVNFAKVATQAILGQHKIQDTKYKIQNYVGVKSPQFSFSRIKGADPILRVEMASTGEVACFGDDVYEAFLKSLIATGVSLPKKSVFISLAGDENKVEFYESAKTLDAIGLKIYATEGTSRFLNKKGIKAEKLFKIHEHKKPNILDFLYSKKIDLVINIFDPYFKKEFDDDYLMRRASIDFGIPLLTNLQTAELFVKALSTKKIEDLKILPWDYYVKHLN
ncbi:carbamoyl phosphate synthase large subunit [Candidatus Curtissbacteria bacterium RIFCSPLOWO2_01_FULL_37_9]|uniref:Carbamoyl phosphate synthase large subunit n=1 Tax=Candidatus Curtissbacteria bacterium RIFCSPLOWO2_01_FULL_37_9 TaxID=1797724 RepID=A0A1F5GVH5_9BACT|nr:MAG: carbamoyl phosphate synthase large subunit [Candidatus Curtissbacteria bacterium RIFCSPLOWO2_01_FULL_37_9]